MSTNLGKTKREEVLRKLTEKAFPPEKFAVAAKPFLDALMASPAMEVPLMLSRDYPEYVCKRESIRMDFPEVRMPWDWGSSFFNRTTVHVPLPKTVAVNFKRDGYVMLEEKDGEYAARYSPSSKEGLPALSDPVWGGSVPYHFEGVSASSQWGELVLGLDAKIWKFFHLGWSFRYRVRIKQKRTPLGQPWYVPGFGKNDHTCFGGTFNLIFDI